MRSPGQHPIDTTSFVTQATHRFEAFLHALQPRVGRLAAVVVRAARHTSPGDFLAAHFCQDKWRIAPFNRPQDFEIHAHKRFNLMEKFEVNSWVRCKCGKEASSEGEFRLVLVEQDMNTLAEVADNRELSSSDVQEYFLAAARELDRVLELYFPED
jgi:hypothetical protein